MKSIFLKFIIVALMFQMFVCSCFQIPEQTSAKLKASMRI